jgi:hypothetical protein
VATRVSLDLELTPLLKALRSRIEGLGESSLETRNGIEVHSRQGLPFLQLELRRDHMYLDLWLPEAKQEEARASGRARAHAFLADAVRVRFERAEDLTRVAHWLEESYRFVPTRLARASAPTAPAEPQPGELPEPAVPAATASPEPPRGAVEPREPATGKGPPPQQPSPKNAQEKAPGRGKGGARPPKRS